VAQIKGVVVGEERRSLQVWVGDGPNTPTPLFVLARYSTNSPYRPLKINTTTTTTTTTTTIKKTIQQRKKFLC
jgi:hypothetical protein